jgi:hypothetical protein
MSEQRHRDLLAHAARRARDQEGFLAGALAAYQEANGMDDAALAAFLGCAPEALPRLALCRRPAPDPARFRAGIQEIAAYTGAAIGPLARLLREVAANEALQGARDTGMMLAARDHLPDASPEPASDAPPPGDEDTNV